MNPERQTQRVKTVFDEWARIGRADRMADSHTPSARPAFDRLGLSEGGHYLDLGCGNGYSVRWATELCGPKGRAVGIDLAPEMISRARAISSQGEFTVAQFPEEPGDEFLPPGSFDAIFTMEVLYYLHDLDAGLQRLATLLRTGGRIISVIDFYGENPASHGWPDDLDCSMTLLDEAGWREAFERAGLTVEDQFRIRQGSSASADQWKKTQGSLATLARRAD